MATYSKIRSLSSVTPVPGWINASFAVTTRKHPLCFSFPHVLDLSAMALSLKELEPTKHLDVTIRMSQMYYARYSVDCRLFQEHIAYLTSFSDIFINFV